MSHLLAVDVSNLIIRHFSNPYVDEKDREGRPVQGVAGAIRQIVTLIERERPTHLLIAQDGPRSESARRLLHPGYKEHRADSDDDQKLQFHLAFKAFDLLGWPVVAYPSHEADDVIASAARRFPGRTTIVTGDRDLLALCSDEVEVLLLRSGGQQLRLGHDGCLDLMGVTPEQLQDYKALAGDTSDGIPGVKGVGSKTAISLLSSYGSLKSVFAAIDRQETLEGIKPHIAKKIAEGRDEARLSWQLAGLLSTLPVDPDGLDLHGHARRPEEIADALREHRLEFLLPKQHRGVDTSGMSGTEAMQAIFENL